LHSSLFLFLVSALHVSLVCIVVTHNASVSHGDVSVGFYKLAFSSGIDHGHTFVIVEIRFLCY